MQLHTKDVRSMSYASDSMSSTGKTLKMTICMNAGFHFAGQIVSPNFPVTERIKTKLNVNDYYAQEYYNYCMNQFAMYPNKYKKMKGEDLMEKCFEILSTLHTVNSDDEDLPAPRRMNGLHEHQSSPLHEMYKGYHVEFGNKRQEHTRIKDLQI